MLFFVAAIEKIWKHCSVQVNTGVGSSPLKWFTSALSVSLMDMVLMVENDYSFSFVSWFNYWSLLDLRDHIASLVHGN